MVTMGCHDYMMTYKAKPLRAHFVDDFREEDDIRGINMSSKFPNLNPTEHVCKGLGRAIASWNLPLATQGT